LELKISIVIYTLSQLSSSIPRILLIFDAKQTQTYKTPYGIQIKQELIEENAEWTFTKNSKLTDALTGLRQARQLVFAILAPL